MSYMLYIIYELYNINMYTLCYIYYLFQLHLEHHEPAADVQWSRARCGWSAARAHIRSDNGESPWQSNPSRLTNQS